MHNQREIEFHELLEFCRAWFKVGEHESCEGMATRMLLEVRSEFGRLVGQTARGIAVTVSEDGECEATVQTRGFHQ